MYVSTLNALGYYFKVIMLSYQNKVKPIHMSKTPILTTLYLL